MRNLFKRTMSKKKWAEAEAESKLWVFNCECGHEFSIWDVGGMRYKARGNPVKVVRCPKCGVKKGRKLRKKEMSE
ncbi:MAG: hypothetical protein C0592_01585 [Marinilabiliales bacterium]|nr:MAG: hypothetical protein C0592_01585 [Marinilabiliales bacterium]